ncbi:MAG: hypothetical protein WCC64_03575, partial [Aliidongia sp.]
MTITEIRILPPLAIGRLGASPHPLENYEFVAPASALGLPTIVPGESLEVKSDGTIGRTYKPDILLFRDGDQIRPVAPFLEVFARIGTDDELVPLTAPMLEQYGATVTWAVIVGNNKIARRTGDPNDGIVAVLPSVTDHARHDLLATSPHFRAGQVLPLGSVRYICPTAEFPEIRLRFTPAAGLVYGAADRRKILLPDNQVGEERDPILSPERILYDSDPGKGTWRGYIDPTSGPKAPYDTNPAQIYAGFSNDKGEWESWGYLDDECDGIIAVSLTIAGQEDLGAFARIGAGPPTFAPDRTPIRTVADELDQALSGPVIQPGQATGAELH